MRVKTAEIRVCSSSQTAWADVRDAGRDLGTAPDLLRLGPNRSINNLSVPNVIVKIYNSFWMEEVFAPIANVSFDGKSKHPREIYLT